MSYASWSPAQIYSINNVVMFQPTNTLYVSLQNGNLNNLPPSSPVWWSTLGGGSGVQSINSETGILTFTGASGVTVSNVGQTFTFAGTGGGGGVTSIEGRTGVVDLVGSGVTITGGIPNAQSITIQNDGVLSVASGGTGITVGGTAQNPTIQNDGVLSVASGGTGITVGGTAQNPTIQNDGVLSLNSQTGATTLQSSGGSITVTNPSAGVVNIEGASLSGYIPYSGATTNVDLGNFGLSCSSLFPTVSLNVQDHTPVGVTPFSAINIRYGLYAPGFAGGYVAVNLMDFTNAPVGAKYMVLYNSGEGNGGVVYIQWNGSGVFSFISGSFSGSNNNGIASSIYGGTTDTGFNTNGNFIQYTYAGHNKDGYGFVVAIRLV